MASVFANLISIDLSDPYIFLSEACLILILSYFYNRLADRTNVPSVIMLILTGMLIRAGIEWTDFEIPNLMTFLEILGILGLIMIVLEASLDLQLSREKYSMIGNSFIAALLSLIGTIAAISMVLHFEFDISTGVSILYATPLAVMSSSIVIPSVSGLVRNKKEFMIYESAFSDIIGILFFYFIISYLENGGLAATSQFVISLILTILLALLATAVLILLFKDLNSQTKLFLLISNLILLYSLGKLFHLSPLIIIMVFGITLANHKMYKGLLKKYGVGTDNIAKIEKEFHSITMESAFLVRTFFFVVFGMTIDLSNLFNLEMFLVCTAVVACIFIIRSITLYYFARTNFFPEVYIAPRGLVTILLFFQIPVHLMNQEVQPGILLYVIILTSLIMTYYLIKDKMIRDKQMQTNSPGKIHASKDSPSEIENLKS